MPEIKREPAAHFRQFAGAMRQMYLALVDEGFTKEEAIQVIAIMMASQRPT